MTLVLPVQYALGAFAQQRYHWLTPYMRRRLHLDRSAALGVVIKRLNSLKKDKPQTQPLKRGLWWGLGGIFRSCRPFVCAPISPLLAAYLPADRAARWAFFPDPLYNAIKSFLFYCVHKFGSWCRYTMRHRWVQIIKRDLPGKGFTVKIIL